MARLVTLFLLLVALVPVAAAQCAFNTGQNATVFVELAGASGLGSQLVALDEHGNCVGMNDYRGDTHTYVTVWGDDIITPEVDGVQPGRPFHLATTATASPTLDATDPYVGTLVYQPDGLYSVTLVDFDSLATATLEALATTEAYADSIIANREAVIEAQLANLDNLQGQVDAALAANATLTANLDAANLTISDLEAQLAAMPDVTELEAQVASLEAQVASLTAELDAANTTLQAIWDEVSRQGNKYKTIFDLLMGASP